MNARGPQTCGELNLLFLTGLGITYMLKLCEGPVLIRSGVSDHENEITNRNLWLTMVIIDHSYVCGIGDL